MNSQLSQQQLRQTFKQVEESIGITASNFQLKFVYPQKSSAEAILINKKTPSPSQLHCISIEHEKNIGYLMSIFIFKAGQSLKIPVSTSIVASAIAHYFFSRKSYIDYDFRDIAMGSVFLACKSQETLRKSYQVTAVFDYIFKVFQSHRNQIKVLELNSFEYNYMKSQVLKAENDILFELGFEVYKLFDIPHRYIGGLLKSFDKHVKSQEIAQMSWSFLNDCYKTDCCLYYTGEAIAAASVYFALIKLKIAQPPVAWWILMEVDLNTIEQIIIELEQFYESICRHQAMIDIVESQLNSIGQAIHGLVNVFPVPYYRKINLDVDKKIKIRVDQIQIQLQIPIKHQLQIPTKDQIQNKQEDKNDHRHHKDKKKKEKHRRNKQDQERKKKKHRKSENRKYSRSRSKDKNQSYSSSAEKQSANKKVNEQKSIKANEQKGGIKVNSQKSGKQQNQIKQQEKNIEQSSIPVLQNQRKTVKQMQIDSAKGLLSKISNQLKLHEQKKIKNQEIQDKQQMQSDEQLLLAQLIKIKKSNNQKELQKN